MKTTNGNESIAEMLAQRNLPPLRSREEMLAILLREEYGAMPPKPESLSFEVEEKGKSDVFFFAWKAETRQITAHCTVAGKRFSFPFQAVIPKTEGKHPFFIHINFRKNNPDRYMPTEELLDAGFGVLSFCYTDVTSDNGDFTDGLAGVLYENGQRSHEDCGKIAMWAWAAQRVMDYAETRSDVLDPAGSVVCGHSRLGKTALLAAAADERFAFAYSNDSGCSGAAVTRDKEGERVKQITTNFPYWFCEDYRQYVEREPEMPFDQHWLIASIAPRFVFVGSATEDKWADPVSELLSCAAASPAFRKGLAVGDRLPEAGDAWLDGDVGYHLREGAHFFSRADWHQLIRFVRRHYRV